MKKTCIIFSALAIIIVSILGVGVMNNQFNKPVHTEYLRIHIRANSNDDKDQEVKYKVKDAVVEYLTPLLIECDSKKKAEAVINDNLNSIEEVANNVLFINGFSYKSSAKINNEEFPTRIYENLTLESGFYDALIIGLGDGTGNNWWCVVYPPLCFTGSGNYVYKSKIKEIIDGFYDKER